MTTYGNQLRCKKWKDCLIHASKRHQYSITKPNKLQINITKLTLGRLSKTSSTTCYKISSSLINQLRKWEKNNKTSNTTTWLSSTTRGISSMGPAKPGKGIELHSGSEQWRQHSLFWGAPEFSELIKGTLLLPVCWLLPDVGSTKFKKLYIPNN